MKFLNRFFRLATVSYKSLFSVMSIKVYFLTKVILPLFSMIFFSLLAIHIYGTEELEFWIIGNTLATCVFPTFIGAGRIMRAERGLGTLKYLIASPTQRWVIFLSGSVMHILDAVMISITTIIISILIFKLNFLSINLFYYFAIVFITMFGAISFGMMISSVGLIIRDLNMIMNIGVLGLMIFSGANIKLALLPDFLLWLPKILPINRGISAARLLYFKGNSRDILNLVSGELIAGIIYMILGFILFQYCEHIARKNATLDLY